MIRIERNLSVRHWKETFAGKIPDCVAKLGKMPTGIDEKLVILYIEMLKVPGSMNRIKHFVEWHVFGVCTAIGEKVGIATATIRKYFIYISFITMGSPLIIYLFIAFWMNIKRYITNARRNPVRYW